MARSTDPARPVPRYYIRPIPTPDGKHVLIDGLNGRELGTLTYASDAARCAHYLNLGIPNGHYPH